MILNMSFTKNIWSRTLCDRWGSYVVLFLFILLSGLPAKSQTSVEDFSLNDVVMKRPVSLADFKSKKAVIVIFFCNGCPYSTIYIERIKKLANSYREIQFLLVNSSPFQFSPEESVENMAKLVTDYSLNMPYLEDKDQVAYRSFGVVKCPEVFILGTSGEDFNVLYHGAIDDNPQVVSDVDEHYLEDAIKSIVAGTGPSQDYVRPNGCVIKKK